MVLQVGADFVTDCTAAHLPEAVLEENDGIGAQTRAAQHDSRPIMHRIFFISLSAIVIEKQKALTRPKAATKLV